MVSLLASRLRLHRAIPLLTAFIFGVTLIASNSIHARDLYKADGVVNDYRYFEVSGLIRGYSPEVTILETPSEGGGAKEFSSFGDFYGVTAKASFPFMNFYYLEAGAEYAGASMIEGKSLYHEESNLYVDNPAFDAMSLNGYLGAGAYMELNARATSHAGIRGHYLVDEYCMRDFACDNFSGFGVSGVFGGKYWLNYWLRAEAEGFGTFTSREGYPVSDGEGGIKEVSETNMLFGFEAKLILLSGQWQIVPSYRQILTATSDYVPEYTQISLGLRYSY